jgi:hypothetical protein
LLVLLLITVFVTATAYREADYDDEVNGYGHYDLLFLTFNVTVNDLACREADYDDTQNDYGHYGLLFLTVNTLSKILLAGRLTMMTRRTTTATMVKKRTWGSRACSQPRRTQACSSSHAGAFK